MIQLQWTRSHDSSYTSGCYRVRREGKGWRLTVNGQMTGWRDVEVAPVEWRTLHAAKLLANVLEDARVAGYCRWLEAG